MDKHNINSNIENYASKSGEYLDKAQEKALDFVSNVEEKGCDMIDKATDIAHDMIDTGAKVAEMSVEKAADFKDSFKKKEFNKLDLQDNDLKYSEQHYECGCIQSNPLEYVKSYALEHPIITATAVSATVLTGASLLNSTTRKITVPVAKYAIKQQAKFTLGVGMLAMATYLSNRMNSNTLN